MQSLLIRVLESSAAKYLIFPAHKRSERSHGNHKTKFFVFSSKQIPKALGLHSLRGKMRFSTAIRARNQDDNVPQREKLDMMSQLQLEKSEVFPTRRRSVNGIFWLLLLNIGIFVADNLFEFWPIKFLYLYHDAPQLYQFITATFCHVNWSHLSSNLFFLYIFGKLVEEEEGGFALWLSYMLTGATANLVSWMILPRTIVTVGASGAVFGLFAISVLIKISWDWRKILEVLILGQFVVGKVMEATQLGGSASRLFPGQNMNHIAHFSGSLMGVFLTWLVSQIPPSKTNGKESP